MPPGSVGRPKKGSVPERGSDTALFAHVAYQLAGVPSGNVDDFASGLGLKIRASPILHARRDHPVAHAARPPGLFRRWLLVDGRPLGLVSALVTLAPRTPEPDDENAQELYRRVASTQGVRAVLLSEARSEVWALTLSDGPADVDRLRGELRGFARILRWEALREESFEPGIATWAHLARGRAAREHLLAG